MDELTLTQLTVGELRHALNGVDDDVVVTLVVPAADPNEPPRGQRWQPKHLTTVRNLVVESYSGGPCLVLRPSEGSDDGR